MKPSSDTLAKIRKEIFERFIKDAESTLNEFKEDAEIWSSRMATDRRLKSVYDAEEQLYKTLYAVRTYEEISTLLRKAMEE